MYMAVIHGYTDIMAFHENKEEAERLAVERKQKLFPALFSNRGWTWKRCWKYCEDYLGTNVYEITTGTVIDEYTEPLE